MTGACGWLPSGNSGDWSIKCLHAEAMQEPEKELSRERLWRACSGYSIRDLSRRGLRSLVLDGSKRLKPDRLALLAPLAPTLLHLSLSRCDRLTSGQHLSALTALTSLDVAGERNKQGVPPTVCWLQCARRCKNSGSWRLGTSSLTELAHVRGGMWPCRHGDGPAASGRPNQAGSAITERHACGGRRLRSTGAAHAPDSPGPGWLLGIDRCRVPAAVCADTAEQPRSVRVRSACATAASGPDISAHVLLQGVALCGQVNTASGNRDGDAWKLYCGASLLHVLGHLACLIEPRLASLQITGNYARSAAAYSHQLSSLRELHLVKCSFDADGHQLLCSAATASGPVLQSLDLRDAVPLQLDFLASCHALRNLALTGTSLLLRSLMRPWMFGPTPRPQPQNAHSAV